MKRLVIGISVLAVLLGLGILVSCLFVQAHSPGSEFLQQAARAADRGDWAAANTAFSNAQTRWGNFRHFTAAFADHTPMEEIDGLFGQLEIYVRQQDEDHFSALCAHLAVLLEAMADSHRLFWWTLL